MKSFIVGLFFILNISLIFSQPNQIDKYRNDNYGNMANRKESLVDANLVRTLFYNNGEVGQWPFSPSGEWPKGSGHGYLDGMALLVAAEISTDNGIVHSLSTSYREWMDSDPVSGTLWGFEPIKGYANPSSNSIALSNNPNTWPEFWPTVLPGVDSSWGGYWYSYFGKGTFNADLESFYVMDDSQDKEFTRAPYNYFPVISDQNRGGLGLRVEVRNFQWNAEIAEDILFLHYDMINLSDYNYEKTIAGFYIDAGIGGSGDSGDDNAKPLTTQDLVYIFDNDGIAPPGGWATGYMGVAFLETATNSTNGIDDDNDGMIDETRDDGIDNDGDWRKFSDLNNNNIWDNNEPLNDDLGMDGIGPDNINYPGADFGQGDGFPTNGEPNFDATDVHESDLIGLTSTSVYQLGDGGTGGGWPKDDEQMWNRLQAANFDTSLQNANISLTMGSGPFLLNSGATQRISSALIFGDDFEDLLFNKVMAQNIYNNNYNLSEVNQLIPVKIDYPASGDTVKGQINILWNTGNYSDPNAIAQIYLAKDEENFKLIGQVDASVGSINLNTSQHEDGILYKLKIVCYDGILYGEDSSEKSFVINNDGNAIPQVKFYKPALNEIVQNEIEISFYGGDADGDISLIDLYYSNSVDFEEAVLIQDGISDQFTKFNWNTLGIANHSNYYLFAKISNDLNTEVYLSDPFIIQNDRYLIKGIELTTDRNTKGTGDFYFSLISPEDIAAKDYRIDINTSSITSVLLYSLFDLTMNEYIFENQMFGWNIESPLFNGGRISVINDTLKQAIDSLTYWEEGYSNLNMIVTVDQSSPARSEYWPEDFLLKFGSDYSYTTPFFNLNCDLNIIALSDSSIVDYEIFDNDSDGKLSLNDNIVIIKDLASSFKLTWNIKLAYQIANEVDPILPTDGDVFRITSSKRFFAGDQIFFKTDQLVNVESNDIVIKDFVLSQNYPNPFNPITIIQYSVPSDGYVSLKVFDILGREVSTLVSQQQLKGSYRITFNGSNLSSGFYIYKLQAGKHSQVRKMMLLK